MGMVGPLAEVTVVRTDAFVVSGPDGDLVPGGDQGFYVRDTRFLDRFQLEVDGRPPRPLSGGVVGADRAEFHGHLPVGPDQGVDPTVLVARRRLVQGGLHEEVTFTNAGSADTTLHVVLLLGTDFAYIFDVKHGRLLPRALGRDEGVRAVWQRAGGVERTVVTVLLDGQPISPTITSAPDGDLCLAADLVLAAGAARRLCVLAETRDVYGEVAAVGCRAFALPARDPGSDAPTPVVHASDVRVPTLLRRAVHDLGSLVMPDPDAPQDRFVAAGSPWYLTLFGRDSLWAALMALPFDPPLAMETLRTLARRQGTRVDHDTEEAPGKILHEVRRGALAERGDLPPNYYGSVDATPLFVVLAHEAWRWGAPREDVEALLPHVEAALDWLRTDGDADGDGFLEYVRHGHRGLANQGWKDSGDGIRFADGTIAVAPLALAEVQGYAFAAARGGADLLDAFGRSDATAWRAWADELALRFRDRFWIEDGEGPLPAVALDRDKRPVDSVASNMGHLLFTGMLEGPESTVVASRLAGDDMSSGFGLRTLSSASGGYNPLSYHCGSVWPHDTAIAAWGLGRCRHDAEASRLLRALVRAAPMFDYRLPELFAGLGRDVTERPVPYPAACRPQAWAAGAAMLMLRTVFGAEADLPSGVLTLRPLRPGPFAYVEVRGLPFGRGTLDVRLRDGDVDVGVHGEQIDVHIQTNA